MAAFLRLKVAGWAWLIRFHDRTVPVICLSRLTVPQTAALPVQGSSVVLWCSSTSGELIAELATVSDEQHQPESSRGEG